MVAKAEMAVTSAGLWEINLASGACLILEQVESHCSISPFPNVSEMDFPPHSSAFYIIWLIRKMWDLPDLVVHPALAHKYGIYLLVNLHTDS